MKDATRDTLREMGKLTQKKCAACPGALERYRCCSPAACDMATITMRELGITTVKPVPGNTRLPYMGKKGCVVPPEFRPHCTMYVCPDATKKKSFAFDFRYETLSGRIKRDSHVMESIHRAMHAILVPNKGSGPLP